MVDRISNRRGDRYQSDFTDSARSELVELLIRKVQEVDFDFGGVGVHRYKIVRQTAIDRCAVLEIIVRVLEKRHPYAHHHRALDLIPASQRVDDLAGIDDGNYPTDAQARDLRLPGDFGEVAEWKASASGPQASRRRGRCL